MKIKVFHTLMAIQNLFDFYNKKILFFSWSVDIKKLAKEAGYEKILNSIFDLKNQHKIGLLSFALL